MKKSFTRFSLFILSLAAGFTAKAQHVDTLYAIDDVYAVTMGGGQGKNSFIKFDISSIPASSVVGNVTFKVNVTEVGASWDGDINFYNVASQTWTEADSMQILYGLLRPDTVNQLNGFGTATGWASSVDIKSIFLRDYNQSNSFCTVMLKDPDDGTFAPNSIPSVDSNDSLMSGNIFNDYIIYHPHEQTDSVPMMIVTYTVAPTITSQPNNTAVCEGTMAGFTVIASGDSPLSYQWQKNGVDIAGANAATYIFGPVTTADADNYRCYVTNSVGSDTSGTVSLTVNTNPIVDLGPDQTICSTTQLDAGNLGSSYLWSTGATDQIIVVSSTGNYDVTVTDANGCKGTDAAMITVPIPPSVNLGPDITACASALLDAGNAGNNYIWSTGAITQTITVTSTGTYYVDVYNICGISSDTVMVTINTNPVVNLGPDIVQCGGIACLDAGNPGSTYLWSDNFTGQQHCFSSVGTGTYYVDVTDANGCTGSDTASVTINGFPTVNLGPDVTACGSTVLDAGPGFASYAWSPNIGNTQAVTVTSSGTYYAIVTDGNGCQGNDTIDVIVYPAINLNLGPDVTVCNSALLDAGNPGNTYWWSTNETTQSITVTSSGQYIAMVWNVCYGDTDTINVTVNPGISPVVNLGPDTVQCGGAVMLDAGNPGDTYVWSTSATTQTITVSQSGMYSVVVTNAGGCTGTDTVNVYIFPVPNASAGNDVTICSGNNVTIGGSPTASGGTLPYTYSWTPSAGLSSTTDANPTASPTTSTTYILALQDSNGCMMVYDTVSVQVDQTIMVDLGPDDTSCVSVMLDAGNPGSNYWWSPGNNSTQTINATSSGMYIVIAWNTCSADTDSVLVYITGGPGVTTSSTPATCGMWDGTATANVTGGTAPYTYSWSTTPVQISATATGLFSGNYTVTIVDAMGCMSTQTVAVSSTTTMLQSTFAAGNAHRGNMFDITAINTVMITNFDGHLQGNTSYEIYYKVGTYVGSEQNAGAWTFVGSDPNVIAQPTGSPTPIPIPVNITIPAGQTYAFYLTSSNVAVSQNYTNGTTAGNVFSSDANIQFKEGCGLEYPFATATPFSPRVWNGRIHYCTGPVGIENILSSEMNVYPNPSHGEFVIASPAKQSHLEIFNLMGEKVYEQTLINDYETITLTEAKGIFFYRITAPSGATGAGKIVIE